MKSLIVSAPHSGAGKTMITLGILRALRDRGVSVGSAKSGPDYIDPQFHLAASAAPCVTLDAWAMTPARLRSLAAGSGSDFTLIEGAMGLFDGAADQQSAFGRGATAEVARTLLAPVVLVLDVAGQGQSAAAVALGLARFQPDVTIAGVILNNVGSERHDTMIRRALDAVDLPVLGSVPRTGDLTMPSRHLGLVQARERPDLEAFIARAATLASKHIDLDALLDAAAPLAPAGQAQGLEPLGQRIAIARDDAFAFSYPHLIDDWRRQGADISFFSPLTDQPPDEHADAVYLPGGYPELHAGKLGAAAHFRAGMHHAADRKALIYGECGGYMALGNGLVDADGTQHAMLGLLPLETSFQQRKLHLGYRTLTCLKNAPWTGTLTAHEFHYASIINEGNEDRVFETSDAMDTNLGAIGLSRGSVMGSFAHVIDRAG